MDTKKLSLVLAVPVVASVIACGGSGTSGPASDHRIKFEVTGPPSSNSITYSVGVDQAQENGAKLPWTKELSSSRWPLIASVVAQSDGTGVISCRITVDGKVVKENSSSGQYAVVTCTNG
jgi:hypothetical protein